MVSTMASMSSCFLRAGSVPVYELSASRQATRAFCASVQSTQPPRFSEYSPASLAIDSDCERRLTSALITVKFALATASGTSKSSESHTYEASEKRPFR